jgi:hypothetical protein
MAAIPGSKDVCPIGKPKWKPATTKKTGRIPKSQTSRANFQKANKMITAIIRHEVRDFAEWKKIFDADLPKVEKAGAKLLGIYTSVKNPNDVTMIFEAPEVELYDTLMSDPERQEAIRSAGVIGVPVASFLNKVQ